MMRLLSTLVLMCTASMITEPSPASDSELTLHEIATPADHLPSGPFARLDDGRIVSVDGRRFLSSDNEGKTWQASDLFAEEGFEARPEYGITVTDAGTIVVAFTNQAERVWGWDAETKNPKPDVELPTYVTRSVDGGRTWEAPRLLHRDWTGAIRSLIALDEGRLVFSSMMMLTDPGRHATVTYSSEDDGKTWQRSNLIDLGGSGHHDGALEATLLQRRDGDVWMLMRTTLDQLWQAHSDDGVFWRELGPSGIDAACGPPSLLRLHSGRVLLLWNRLTPSDGGTYPRQGGDGQWAHREAVNIREELSMSLTEDDGQTWLEPIVLATRPGSRVAYPHAFEVAPGELWITSGQGHLRVKVLESHAISAMNDARSHDDNP